MNRTRTLTARPPLALALLALLAPAVQAQGTVTARPVVKQWASAVVTRSSEYGPDSWAAKQALGEPNTMTYGDHGTAWASAERNGVVQSITVAFATPVYATGVLVRETFGNGFVRRIFAVDPSGRHVQVWAGKDTSTPNYTYNFIATFPKTDFLVKAVKIVIDPNHNPNTYEEIDAVQLIGVAP